MTRHFVRLTIANKTFQPTQVSTDGCSNVADFRHAIKNKCPNLLAAYDAAQLKLFQPDGKTEIDPQTLVSDLKEIPWKPMVVTVEELPRNVSTRSSKKHVACREFNAGLTCIKFLDAIARNFALIYDFKWGRNNDRSYPIFDDVLFAYENNAWEYRHSERTNEPGVTQVTTPVPRRDVPLPEYFDKADWVQLKSLSQKINNKIYDGNVPTTPTGKYCVIVPHADYNDETISCLKAVGVKGFLLPDESKLEVKDEGAL